MNNDIKEILEELKNEDNYIEDYEFRYKRIALDDVWELLDYITNLQQENERLIQGTTLLSNTLIDMTRAKEDYKSRIDKAIKYIKENCIDDEFYVNLTNKEKHIIEVLNILNSDKE